MPLIPFTLARLIDIWIASRVALPALALGVATIVAVIGIILAWRAPWLVSDCISCGAACNDSVLKAALTGEHHRRSGFIASLNHVVIVE